MINNRQGGRRRGRGGQRPQGMSGRPDGNRQDNRQRGNAAQLLEKYKALARDMQLAGDRVQTEYYLQFADHYFRVLEDGRSRFEEQNQRRPRDEEDRDGDEEAASADNQPSDGDDNEEQRPAPRRDRNRHDGEARGERPQRTDRPARNDRYERPERNDRPERSERPERNERPEYNDREQTERPALAEGNERPALAEGNERPERSRSERPVRPRRELAPLPESEERIAVSVLPPAIGVGSDEPEVEAVRPRRRVRKPRDESSDDIAPAA
ncbi:MAG: DUF4167 domain-containing protein [Sphingomonas sp.]|nr:DUF4167 domain-containing protein [Sphingomonas sp.]